MIKCSICNTRKGKRKCQDTDTFICSLCCGSSRTEQKCLDCQFYQDSSLKRNYFKLPYFEIQEMSDDFELQSVSEFIEKALCIFDENHYINDEYAMGILECLLDKYHFNDSIISFENRIEEQGFLFINEQIVDKYKELPPDILTKVISTVMRSLRRHKNGIRGYMDFIQQYVNF